MLFRQRELKKEELEAKLKKAKEDKDKLFEDKTNTLLAKVTAAEVG